MSPILSQEEFERIQKAFQDGTIFGIQPGDDAETRPEVQEYDLMSQERISRGRMPGLDIIVDRLMRYLQIAISNSTRRVIDVELEVHGLMKFGDFLNDKSNTPCSYTVFRMSPLRGTGIIVMEHELLFALLNTYFGGTVTAERKTPTRSADFTLIEINIIRKVINLVLEEFSKSWAPVHDLHCEYQRTEVNPQFIEVVPHSDLVINIDFMIRFEELESEMNILIPYATIEPIKEKLSFSHHGEELELDISWVSRLREQLLQSSVNGRVELGTTQITVQELRNLKPGDLLKLDTDYGQPLIMRVEGVEKIIGQPVVHNGNLAINVQELRNNIVEEGSASASSGNDVAELKALMESL